MGFYFAQQGCEAFTLRLVEMYNELRQQGKKFEVIFISSDLVRRKPPVFWLSSSWFRCKSLSWWLFDPCR